MKKWKPGREALLLLFFPVYLLLYFAAEHYVTTDYWVSWCALDDLIPFVQEFVYFYLLWFPLMIGMTLWLLVKDARAFWRYGITLIITTLIGYAIFFIFPSGQDLRPAEVDGGGLSGFIMRIIYSVDTNTNVFPSLHVVGTLVAVAGAFDTDTIAKPLKWVIAVVGTLICLSTVFIKQHSVLDILGAVAVFVPVWLAVYIIPDWLRRRKQKRANAA